MYLLLSVEDMSQAPQEQWGTRFRKGFDTHPVLVVLVVGAIFVSSILTITGAVGDLGRWYRATFQWREVAYAKLEALRARFSFQQFQEDLGPPVFERSASRGRILEHTFAGRDYWVQTVTDKRENTVLMYSVTSCPSSFTPSFEVPTLADLDDGPRETHVTLGRSHLTGVRVEPEILEVTYFISGATANSFFYDYFYGGNPSNYKSYAWGINDACPADALWVSEMYERGLLPFEGTADGKPVVTLGPYAGGGVIDNASIQEFRRAAIANTYAETAPGTSFAELSRYFQIGVDRGLVSTVGAERVP